jgi:phosphatidate cytidylyltransferase
MGLLSIGIAELSRFAHRAGVNMLRRGALVGAALIGTGPLWWQFVSPVAMRGYDLLLILSLVTLAIFAEQMIRDRTHDALRQIAVSILAVAYLGLGTGMILAMRISFSMEALILFLAACKFTDIGAFFTGTAIGRHKMIPWLSPGKSWEGLVGGLTAGAGITVALVFALGVDQVTVVEAIVFGAVVGAAGQFADLCESLLKRSAGVKDSGALIPNFGGVLDLVDSPLLSAPVGFLAYGIIG